MKGLNTSHLKIIIAGENEMFSHTVGVILPMREEGNLLLCTLLLGNVAFNTLLVIMMADITNGTIVFL